MTGYWKMMWGKVRTVVELKRFINRGSIGFLFRIGQFLAGLLSCVVGIISFVIMLCRFPYYGLWDLLLVLGMSIVGIILITHADYVLMRWNFNNSPPTLLERYK